MYNAEHYKNGSYCICKLSKVDANFSDAMLSLYQVTSHPSIDDRSVSQI